MTTITTHRLFMFFFCIIVAGVLFGLLFSGIEERDFAKIYAAVGLASAIVLATIVYWSYQGWIAYSNYRRRKLEETGVLSFVRSHFPEAEIRRAITGQSSRARFKQAVESWSHEVEANGIVCGEELVGVVENGHLYVTVTQRNTRKAFRRLPKHLRKHISVMYVG